MKVKKLLGDKLSEYLSVVFLLTLTKMILAQSYSEKMSNVYFILLVIVFATELAYIFAEKRVRRVDTEYLFQSICALICPVLILVKQDRLSPTLTLISIVILELVGLTLAFCGIFSTFASRERKN